MLGANGPKEDYPGDDDEQDGDGDKDEDDVHGLYLGGGASGGLAHGNPVRARGQPPSVRNVVCNAGRP
ncbi:hypothetical protein D3C86_2214810 [compost metagenome]